MELVKTNSAVTIFDRVKQKKPCPFGADGRCCKTCSLGPCRVSGTGDVGVCGASAEVIAARNFCRMVAAGTAAHSDHAREVALLFRDVARGEVPGFEIKDEQKLLQLALDFGVEIGSRHLQDIAIGVGERALAEFGKQEGELAFVKRAPLKRQELWRKLGIVPRGIDREVVEMLHRTSVGVDQDYRSLMRQGMRTALADGWGSSMIATDLQDVLFGTPAPVRGKVNLGVLREDEVNIILHGHDPLLPEVIVQAAQNEELLALARVKGAKGINLAGICCTANELVMRHGIPIAGAYLQQELAVTTGAVEAIVVDVQCIMPSLVQVAGCYHTEVITTSERAKLTGAVHLEFNHHNALEVAKKIVRRAVENYANRGAVDIPQDEMDMVAGFSRDTINYLLGGLHRASFRPLNANIIDGRIFGTTGIVGCNNPRVNAGYVHETLVRELIANNVLVVTTGCGAINAARAGLLRPEAAAEAGSGLREVCEAIGIPPVLHMGSCVDTSRILLLISEQVKEGGLGDDVFQRPSTACAPEWMSEKAIAIGQYAVASGVRTIFGASFPTTGSEIFSDFLFNEIEDLTKTKWVFEPDPLEMAQIILTHLGNKRKALGIDKTRKRIFYDMAMRRALDAF